VAGWAGDTQLVVEKYVENRPNIGVTFDGPPAVLQVLKTDLQVVDHFNYTINMPGQVPYRFDFKFFKNGDGKWELDVTYLINNQVDQIRKYKTNDKSYYPFLVHQAVYDINDYFHLPKVGFLIRKVLYSVNTAPLQADIYLADYSLTFRKRIITGGLNIFPKWANDEQTQFFFTKMDYLPTLYKYDLTTGERTKILTSQGMLVASDRRGDQLLLTMAPHGAPDIYLYNMKTGRLKRITTSSASDVSGHFWGKDRIAFVSDRYGSPLVFSKNLKTGVVKRVLYWGNNQVGLDTYKDYMVISSRESNNAYGPNTFNLFLVNLNNYGLERLTTSGQNGYPNFSVDGSSIMFIKRIGLNSQIGIIRLQERKVFYYPLAHRLQSFDW
jgi:TolB protein